MEPATLQPHGDLGTLVRRRRQDGVVAVPVPEPRSVKDAVESVGIPHTEVGAVRVDAVEVGWDRRLRGGEVVDVHPVGRVPPGLHGLVRPAPPPAPVRAVADVHLGALARRLRWVGIDTRWRNDADDADLAALAAGQERVLLTRDRGLLMRRQVVHGVLVRAHDPDAQLAEVVARLDLADQLAPGTRCPRCNGVVQHVARGEVLDELEPGTRAAGYDRFGRCRDCRQLYWAGAHAADLEAIVQRAHGTPS